MSATRLYPYSEYPLCIDKPSNLTGSSEFWPSTRGKPVQNRTIQVQEDLGGEIHTCFQASGTSDPITQSEVGDSRVSASELNWKRMKSYSGKGGWGQMCRRRIPGRRVPVGRVWSSGNLWQGCSDFIFKVVKYPETLGKFLDRLVYH